VVGTGGIQHWLAGATLFVATSIVALAYVHQAQSARDLIDQTLLVVAPRNYGANVRMAERYLARAEVEERTGVDEDAERLFWAAAHGFARAAGEAPGPRQAVAANDRAARLYLALGRDHLARGRGRVFGLGRRPEALALAERAAACVVGLAPTGLRREIDAFVSEVEEVLDRRVAASCPR
jgi:hypothetical protein